MEIELLREQLVAMKQKMYGPSSEKRRHPNDGDPADAKSLAVVTTPGNQPDLPIEEVMHTLAEEERTCSICGQLVLEMGDQAEESEEVTVIGVEYKILKHRRQRYRCRCTEQILTTPGRQSSSREVDTPSTLPSRWQRASTSITRRSSVRRGQWSGPVFLSTAKRCGTRSRRWSEPGPNMRLAHCWAHVRRKFLETEDAHPELSEHTVTEIGMLFEIEREVPRLRR
jgi:hypothetical protein